MAQDYRLKTVKNKDGKEGKYWRPSLDFNYIADKKIMNVHIQCWVDEADYNTNSRYMNVRDCTLKDVDFPTSITNFKSKVWDKLDNEKEKKFKYNSSTKKMDEDGEELGFFHKDNIDV